MNTIAVGTELSIYEVTAMQHTLAEALGETESVTIDCANLRSFDGAGLQWMLVVDQFYGASKASWVNVPDAVTERLAHLGVKLGTAATNQGAL